MASGMNVDDALNLLLQEQATFGGSHAAAATQPLGGSPAAVTMGPSGGSPAAVPKAPPGIPQILGQPDVPMTLPVPGQSTVSPISNKMMASSSPRGRRLTSPQSRTSSKPPFSPNLDGKLTAAEKANEKLERDKMELEKRLKKMTEEASTNEKAWEHAVSQRHHEVGRLQDIVTHASKQNQQLRWSEEAQAQEIHKWSEHATLFKREAERLTVIENTHAKERETLKQEAQRVFAQARTSNAQYEAETQRLRDQLTTVVSAGRAIEAQQARQCEQFA